MSFFSFSRLVFDPTRSNRVDPRSLKPQKPFSIRPKHNHDHADRGCSIDDFPLLDVRCELPSRWNYSGTTIVGGPFTKYQWIQLIPLIITSYPKFTKYRTRDHRFFGIVLKKKTWGKRAPNSNGSNCPPIITRTIFRTRSSNTGKGVKRKGRNEFHRIFFFPSSIQCSTNGKTGSRIECIVRPRILAPFIVPDAINH